MVHRQVKARLFYVISNKELDALLLPKSYKSWYCERERYCYLLYWILYQEIIYHVALFQPVYCYMC